MPSVTLYQPRTLGKRRTPFGVNLSPDQTHLGKVGPNGDATPAEFGPGRQLHCPSPSCCTPHGGISYGGKATEERFGLCFKRNPPRCTPPVIWRGAWFWGPWQNKFFCRCDSIDDRKLRPNGSIKEEGAHSGGSSARVI